MLKSLLVLLFILIGQSSVANDCFDELSEFTISTQSHSENSIRILLEDGSPNPTYVGREGFLQFTIDSGYTSMGTSFKKLTAAQRKKLKWPGDFTGSPEQFVELIDALESGEFKSIEGYFLIAETLFAGNLGKTFKNASSVLSKSEFLSLNWGSAFNGSTTEYEKLKNALDTGLYTGLDGYISISKLFYNGAMLKAFTNSSAILGKNKFQKLSWGKSFKGNTESYTSIREKVLSGKYNSRNGYLKFANELYEGDMKLTFENVSAVLSTDEFSLLNWSKQFQGHTSDYDRLTNELVSGEFFERNGYKKYALKHYNGNMARAYMDAKSLLADDFEVLEWGTLFKGDVEDYNSIYRDLISGEFNGALGKEKFSIKYSDSRKKKAYEMAKSILSKWEYESLGWGKVTD